MRVGFIGTGRMGSAIAGRVLHGGNTLTVWNRTREKTVELADRGAQVAASVADACADADAVLTMLANDEVLLEVALGPGGNRRLARQRRDPRRHGNARGERGAHA